MRRMGLLLALGLVFSVGAVAQEQRVRVRGQIEVVDGNIVQVKGRDGMTYRITLAENAGVNAVVPAKLEDIKPGSYVGTAAVPQGNGVQRAIEVLIFPEAMRGTGEGHFPWDLTPESTMTNATVESSVAAVDGRMLTLKYKDGDKKVAVPPEAPIVTFEPGDRSLLKTGNHVFVTTTKAADGSLAASRISVGKDGFVPPM